MDEEQRDREILDREDQVRERIDENGNRWLKVYFGGGAHFRNWLDQTQELRGKENVDVEELESVGLQCFEQGEEKMYRIWVRESGPAT